MKKSGILAVVSIILILVMLFSSCGSVTSDKETTHPHETSTAIKVAIVQYNNSNQANEIRQAFIARMRTLGYDEVKMKYDIKNAQGNVDTLNTIAASLIGSDYDLIVPIMSESAKAIKATGNTIPSVFIGACDPVGQGLSSNIKSPDGNMTGTAYKTSPEDLLKMINILTPSVRTVGVLYISGHTISDNDVERAKSYLQNNGYTVEEKALDSTADIENQINGLVTRVDAIYIPADEDIDMVMSNITTIANKNSKFIFASTSTAIDNGALACVCPSATELAKNSALLADRILKSDNVSSVSINEETPLIKYISNSTAYKMGVDVPTLDEYTLI